MSEYKANIIIRKRVSQTQWVEAENEEEAIKKFKEWYGDPYDCDELEIDEEIISVEDIVLEN